VREILFRGKPLGKIDEDFVYGSLGVISTDLVAIYQCEEYYEDIKTLVDIGTVGQYTGLTDKNGKKIFEGDIISIPFEEDRSPWEENCIYYKNGEVYFSAERHGWYVRFYDNETLSLWEYDEVDIKVINNIHDNPDLLKGGD
jgi:uncharacterized phage protein (TIGR01671 family)